MTKNSHFHENFCINRIDGKTNCFEPISQLGESQVELTQIFISTAGMAGSYASGDAKVHGLDVQKWDQVGVVEGRKYTIFSRVLVH